MTFNKEQKTHHLKIYPEHFSAVLTGVKRAELRKNDRDFKVGDTLHLMETPKGSCSPTGEFVNAVVTHIADVGDWLPGYVLLSIEREPAYTAQPVPVMPNSGREQFEEWFKFHHGEEGSIVTLHRANGGANYRDEFVDLAWIAWNACRAAMLQGAEPVSTDYTLPADVRGAINRLLDSDGSRGTFSAVRSYDAREELERLLAAAPQPEVK